jgi:hypothetical protein
MCTRTLGLGSVLALLALPTVVLAQQGKSSDDGRVDRLPALIAPIIAQVESSSGTTKASPTAAKETAAKGTTDPVSRQEFNTAVSRLEDRLESIAQSLSKNNPEQPAKNQPTPADPRAGGEAKPAANQAGPTQAEFNALRDRVYDQEVILANVAKKISQPGGADRYIVDIRGNLQNSTFRKDLADAVGDVLPRQGTLHIRNTMSTTQTITVNGQEYQIPAGDQLVVNVPVGTATTELVGFEAPRNWTISPPTNEERIVIGPAPVRRVAGYAPSTADAAAAPSVYAPAAPAAAAPTYVPAATPAATVIVTPACGCSAY